MKSRKIFLVAFVIMLLCAFKFFPVSLVADAMAQGSEAKESDISLSDKKVLVATVNIYDSKIISQENNNLKLSFDLSNREYVQPDIRYLVQLIKEDENGAQLLVDEMVYTEVISLGENQIIKKEIEYTAPDFISGEYQIYVVAKNQNGLPLALSNVGKVELAGSNNFVEILYDTCYVRINGDETAKYSAAQGVDIKSNESLVAFCEVINRTSGDIKLSPEIKTFWRSSSGPEIDIKNNQNLDYSLLNNERKELSFELPKPSNPQAYDAKLKLKNLEGEIVSNEANFHYVLRGQSATIQNFILDKESYQEGDNVKASIFWSKSADGFVGSRFDSSELENYFVEVSMLNEKNKNCTDEFKNELDKSKIESRLNFFIKRECVNPTVLVSIQDKDGNVLDSKEYRIGSSNYSNSSNQGSKSFIFYGVIFIIILTLIGWLFILSNKKNAKKIVLFFISCSFASMLMIANKVSADVFMGSYKVSPQFSSNFHELEYTLTANPSKLNYYASEGMSGTMIINQLSCLNSLTDYNMIINLRDGHSSVATRGISTGNGVAYSHSSWSNAPSVVGSYDAKFTFKDNRCFSNSGGCLSAISSYGSTYFNNELYSSNLNSYFNSTEFQGRNDWTDAQTRQYCIDTSGSLYNHYIQYGKVQGVSPCKMNCNSSAQNFDDANHKWPVAYNVNSPGIGQCGSRNGIVYPLNMLNWPGYMSTGFCDKGDLSPVYPIFPTPGNSVSWTCTGAGGGSVANCSASRDQLGSSVPTLNFWATPNPVLQYNSFDLKWEATGVEYCKPTSYTYYYPAGNLPIVGSSTVSSHDYAKYFGMKCYTSTGSFIEKEVYVGITYPDVDGECGSNINNGLPYSSSITAWPSNSNVAFCGKGNSSPSSSIIQFPPQGVVVSWRCIGTGAGSSTDCLATRVLSNPEINFWADSTPLVYLNDGFDVQNEKSVKLNWDIINSGDACSCGYGCSCTLYDKDNNIVAEKPYNAADSSYVNVGMGSNEFKLVCVNQNLVESTAVISLTGTCLETNWDIDDGCSVACGGGELYKRRIKTDCDLEKIKIGDCNPESCPVKAEIREVKP